MTETKQMSHLRSIEAAFAATVVLATLAVGCSSSDDSGAAGAEAGTDAGAEAPAEYLLTQQFALSIPMSSAKFNETRRIPRVYSCEKEDISAPITWGDVPEGTVSLALVVDSNQVPGAPWVHWVLWGIPADAGGLPEAVAHAPEAPSVGPKAGQGTNSDKKVGWSGPCPPPVTLASPEEFRRPNAPRDRPESRKVAKTYTFRLYALDIDVALGLDATKADLLQAIDGHVLAGGELVGEFVGKVIALNPLGRKASLHPDSHTAETKASNAEGDWL